MASSCIASARRHFSNNAEVRDASAGVAALLRIGIGAAVFEISQLSYGETGRVVEDRIGWYRGDRYKYVGEIRHAHA